MTSSASTTGHIYFNPGELSLLLEATPGARKTSQGTGGHASLTSGEIEALTKLLATETKSGAITQLHEQNILTDSNGRQRALVPMPRTIDGVRSILFLQTVNLSRWSDQPVEGQTGDDLKRAVQEVTAAVHTLNELLLAKADTTLGRFRIVAASPNWRAAPSSWCGPPSPAGRPRAVPLDRPLRVYSEEVVERTVRFLAKRLSSKKRSRRRVRIAVFDTWPFDELDALTRDAGAKLEAIKSSDKSGDDGRRLQRVISGMMVNQMFDFVRPMNLDQISAPLSRFDLASGTRDQPYDMRDHGLFVADLIDQIAPDAELHVYRILTNAGPVDVDSLARAVEHALARAEHDGVKLVLNFSFGFGLDLLTAVDLLANPAAFLDDNHQQGWVTVASSNAKSREYRLANDAAWRDHTFDLLAGRTIPGARRMFWSTKKPERYRFINAIALLQRLFYFKEMDNVLAVAAAGNQSTQDLLFPPQLPAAIEGVLGVSAVRMKGKDSVFSNADDLLPPDDGIGALGGEVSENGLDTTDGPMALFLSATIPDGNDTENCTGRAVWAGTSFAAPVASGIAAQLWMEYGDNSAQDIINAITAEGQKFIPHGGNRKKPLRQV
jgi:hypothetical protein